MFKDVNNIKTSLFTRYKINMTCIFFIAYTDEEFVQIDIKAEKKLVNN